MPAYGYEFYLLVVNSISHSFAALTREISSWPLEDKIHIHARACNILYILLERSCANLSSLKRELFIFQKPGPRWTYFFDCRWKVIAEWSDIVEVAIPESVTSADNSLKPATNLVCTVPSMSYCTMCIVMFWDVVISTHLGDRNLCTILFFILLITIFFLTVEVPPILSKGARTQLKSPPITICISACLLRLSLSFVKNVFWRLLSFGL